MNFFFAINNNFLKCTLSIPRFRNKEKTNKNFLLYSAEIVEKKWSIKNVDCEVSKNFFFLNDKEFSNDKIFFLAKKNIGKNFFLDELKNFNNYTNTTPDYRANLHIEINDGGFSSYQSDYSFDMTLKTGSVLSPINVLLTKNAEKNIIFFRNIYKLPVKYKFNIYFVDILNEKILHKETVLTNTTNQINVDTKLINSNIYLFSENYIGIPIFVSIKNLHISMEHTHPPHLYVWGTDRFQRVQNLKNRINEIIKKNI